MTLEKLYSIIKDRAQNGFSDSYVASLVKRGEDRVIQKVGEEAIEVVIAMKGTDKKEMIAETSDLIFHLLILLCFQKISVEEIYEELEKRSQKSE